jgi:hypothetical protein
MGKDTQASHKTNRAENREDRLKSALKANMAKRKAQVRARGAQSTENKNKTEESR